MKFLRKYFCFLLTIASSKYDSYLLLELDGLGTFAPTQLRYQLGLDVGDFGAEVLRL